MQNAQLCGYCATCSSQLASVSWPYLQYKHKSWSTSNTAAEHVLMLVHAERDPLHQGLIVERAKLKPRGYQLDLASRLGKTQVVTNSTPLNQQVACCANTTCICCNHPAMQTLASSHD